MEWVYANGSGVAFSPLMPASLPTANRSGMNQNSDLLTPLAS